MFDAGEYTLAPYKVIWTRVSDDISGAVVSTLEVCGIQKPVIPLETAVMVNFKDEKEANYFCAVLNSTPWRFVIVSTAVHGTGGFGSPNVLTKARIPRYEPDNITHNKLSELSRFAHLAADKGESENLHEIEREIDQLASQIWGLSAGDLQEIQDSLAELG
jgi:hypothetical protein